MTSPSAVTSQVVSAWVSIFIIKLRTTSSVWTIHIPWLAILAEAIFRRGAAAYAALWLRC
jgi:hypothetical protein